MPTNPPPDPLDPVEPLDPGPTQISLNSLAGHLAPRDFAFIGPARWPPCRGTGGQWQYPQLHPTGSRQSIAPSMPDHLYSLAGHGGQWSEFAMHKLM